MFIRSTYAEIVRKEISFDILPGMTVERYSINNEIVREPTSLVEFRNGTIAQRLRHVYDFTRTQIDQVSALLDVGTYNGLGLPLLSRLCKKLYSIDIDTKKLQEACLNPVVQPLLGKGNTFLHQMDARDLAFSNNAFDAATIIEVFGAGFEGEESDIHAVFGELHRVLKPEGRLLFTIKSRQSQDIFRPFEWAFPKGYPLHRETIATITKDMFTPINWYGQLIIRESPEGIVMPAHINGLLDGRAELIWNKDAFIPRQIVDEARERPMYWIGVCDKL